MTKTSARPSAPLTTAVHAADPPRSLLEVRDLRTWLGAEDPVRAVDGVSLRMARGEALGLVGESGSGKSILARSIMGLLPESAATSGQVLLDGVDVLGSAPAGRAALWGRTVAMVFQDAGRALNPVVRIGRQMCEGMTRHLGISSADARRRAVELLGEVGVPEPAARLSSYPHELSGGQRQRVMIAMALAGEPDLLIADEPTTALDVTVQRQILDLLGRVRADRDMGLLLITHDLALVAGRTDRTAVMYAGRLVEIGPTPVVFAAPRHRYASALLESTPSLSTARGSTLRAIPGGLPDPRRATDGCRFAPRCEAAAPECAAGPVPFAMADRADHRFACLRPVGPGTRGQVCPEGDGRGRDR
ncbi:ABC transporter ATP-binding protein [Pseudonocardia dioxanivorans]|uniref:ABC transporter ATP-binding protein n=1 Tax=Pseudonocardia dioxanivorans TaxID=240495 RepID=UPI001F25674F|nr:ABC transporter ATP-binding protein [Pseudonocardia dioxanivorans]